MENFLEEIYTRRDSWSESLKKFLLQIPGWLPERNSLRNSSRESQLPGEIPGLNDLKKSAKKICGENRQRNFLINFWAKSPVKILDQIPEGIAIGNLLRNFWRKPLGNYWCKSPEKTLDKIFGRIAIGYPMIISWRTSRRSSGGKSPKEFLHSSNEIFFFEIHWELHREFLRIFTKVPLRILSEFFFKESISNSSEVPPGILLELLREFP